MKRILFVDDDPNIRQGLKRMLYSMRLDWEIDFAENGPQALTFMDQKIFDVIVCDMRMPGMSGLEVLKTVSECYPKTIRFVLSGMVDKETGLQITKYAHQFMAKPCDTKILLDSLQRAFALGSILYDGDLKNLISKLKNIPSLPSLYTNIMEEIQSPQASLEKIGTIIEQDPSMCAKVLQLVNSAFFGIKQNIVNPVQATTFLGIDVIKDLVLSISLFSQFDPQLLRRLGIGSLWDHSAIVGIYAKTIAKTENQTKTMLGYAFTAGILHDIGKLVLAENYPMKYYSTLGNSAKKRIELFQAEKETFGATHAQIGAYLLGLWGLPDMVVEAVAYHHTPTDSPLTIFSTISAVYAANFIDHDLHSRSWSSKKQEISMDYLEKIGTNDRFPVWQEDCHTIKE